MDSEGEKGQLKMADQASEKTPENLPQVVKESIIEWLENSSVHGEWH